MLLKMSQAAYLLCAISFSAGIGYSDAGRAATTITNVEDELNARIKAKGMFPVKVIWTTQEQSSECFAGERASLQGGIDGPGHDHDHCRTVKRTVQHSRVEQQYLTASDPTIEATELPVFGAVKYESFPEDSMSTSQENLNCSSSPGVANISLQLQANRSYSLTVSKSVSHVRSKSVGVGASFFGVGVKGEMGFSDQATTTRATGEGVSNTYTISGTGSVTMPPKSRTISLLSSYRMRQSLPFTMNVLVDGSLSTNAAGKKKVSDILSEAERRFDVQGVLSSDNASAGTLKLLDANFSEDLCIGSTGLIQKEKSLEGEVLRDSKLPMNSAKIAP